MTKPIKARAASNKAMMEIPVSEIFSDKAENYRHLWKYNVGLKENYDPSKGEKLGFLESIIQNGVQVPIEIVLLSDKQKDGIEVRYGLRPNYLVIRGNRRFDAVTQANVIKPDTFTTLTCMVHTGLTDKDIARLRFDHVDVEGLDEYELYKAIISLNGAGYSVTEIYPLVGEGRNYVQRRVYLFSLPGFVHDEYLKRFTPITVTDDKGNVSTRTPVKNKDYVHFGWEAIDKMHPLWSQDMDAKRDPGAEGSLVREYWDDLVGKTSAPPKGPNVKSLSKKEMDNTRGHIRGLSALETACDFYSGNGGSLEAAANEYKTLESQASLVPTLKRELSELRTLLAEKDTEIDHLKEMVKTLTPTNGHAVTVANVA